MSAEATTPDAGAAAAHAGKPDQPAEVGLWRERWFRVLTILNVTLLTASAIVALLIHTRSFTGVVGTLVFIFPVVPVTVSAPIVSAGIVLVAAAFSCLGMIVHRQKGVRFLRAFTVWGTLALTAPPLLAGFWFALVAFASGVGALW